MNQRQDTRAGFTILELLVVVTIISVLTTLGFTIASYARAQAHRATCASNLRQLGIVVQLYLSENDNTYFPYKQKTPEGTLWYFGLETGGSGGEGERKSRPLCRPTVSRISKPATPSRFARPSTTDPPSTSRSSRAPAGPTAITGTLGDTWRGRYPLRTTELSSLSEVIVFADCAQANDFQAPASADNPLLEEFYLIDDTFKTIHFRHNHAANFLYADGHVESHKMLEGTRDERMKSEELGRITPVDSQEFLR